MPRRRRRRRTADGRFIATRSSPPRRRRRRRRINPPAAQANPRRRRRRRRNPGTAVVRYASNAPRRRRRRRTSNPFTAARRFRRNPSFSVRGMLRQAEDAAKTAVQIVGGKIATRVVRNYIPGGKPAPGAALSPVQIGIELGAATLVGYLASMFLGNRVGANAMAGGFVGVLESVIKTYKVPVAADALGDDGDPNVINVPAGMAGYVREQVNNGLSGYVNDGSGTAPENGALSGYGPGPTGVAELDEIGVTM